MRNPRPNVRLSLARLLLLVVAATVLAGCGAPSHTRLETVQIDIRATGTGGLSVEPRGKHLNWPVNATVKLVNNDSVGHSLYFPDLGQELMVGAAAENGPRVAFYSLGALPRGTHRWFCRAGCPAPQADGYLHVA